MTTTTELQAFLAPANDLTERDLNDAIDVLIDLAQYKFGTCHALNDLTERRVDEAIDSYILNHVD